MVLHIQDYTVQLTIYKMVVYNTILGRSFQIKVGVVDSKTENMITSAVFGTSFPITNELPTNEEYFQEHVMCQ